MPTDSLRRDRGPCPRPSCDGDDGRGGAPTFRPSHRGDGASSGRTWHDGAVPDRRRPRQLLSIAALAVGLSTGVLAACGDDRANTPTTVDERTAAETLSTNPFIPEDVNIGDCVSALPRPGCGNEIRGDSHSALTFGVLVLGLTFIGWRITRSVRRRDRTVAPASGPSPQGRPRTQQQPQPPQTQP